MAEGSQGSEEPKTSEASKLPEALGELRQRIDDVDSQLLQLISQRARLAAEVAAVKTSAFSAEETVVQNFYRPEREAQVLRKIMQENDGPLPDADVARLFREIMSACLALEKPLRIDSLGYAGGLTHLAALRHFGQSAVPSQTLDVEQVFEDVEAGRTDFAVLPFGGDAVGLEGPISAIAGAIGEGYVSFFLRHDVRICGEVRIALAAPSRTPVEGAPAPRQQRFIVLGRGPVPASGNDTTSVICGLPNEPGALYHLLAPFHSQDISILRLETARQQIPAGSKSDGIELVSGEQFFVIDFPGHEDHADLHVLFDELRELTSTFKIIGSYPNGVL